MPVSAWGGALAACAALAATLAWPGGAHASPSARLSWERPENDACPTADAVAHDVDGLLGRRAFDGAGRDVVISAALREHGETVVAELEARVAGEVVGVRQLTAPRADCAALRRPIALVLAMLLDDASALVKPAAQEDTPRRRWSAAGAVGAQLGLLPRATPSLELTLAAELASRLTLSLRAGYAFPVAAESASGAGGRFQALLGELSVCPVLTLAARAYVLRSCAGLALDALLATPVGALEGPGTQARLVVAVPLGLSAALHLSGSTWLELGLGPSFTLLRPAASLVQRDGRELAVHRPAAVAGFFRMSLIIRPR